MDRPADVYKKEHVARIDSGRIAALPLGETRVPEGAAPIAGSRSSRGCETGRRSMRRSRGERAGNGPAGKDQHSEVNRHIVTVDQPATIPIRDYSAKPTTGTSDVFRHPPGGPPRARQGGGQLGQRQHGRGRLPAPVYHGPARPGAGVEAAQAPLQRAWLAAPVRESPGYGEWTCSEVPAQGRRSDAVDIPHETHHTRAVGRPPSDLWSARRAVHGGATPRGHPSGARPTGRIPSPLALRDPAVRRAPSPRALATGVVGTAAVRGRSGM
jgi:hypothetical protein